MIALLEAILRAPTGAILAGAGLLLSLAATLVDALLLRTSAAGIDRVVEMVLGGQAHEARVAARKLGTAAAPLLEVLSVGVMRPARPRVDRAIFLIAVAAAPTIAVPIYGFGAVGLAAPETAPAVAVGLMLGLAVVLPASLAAALLILQLEARAARAMRAACVKVMAKQIRDGELEATRPERG